MFPKFNSSRDTQGVQLHQEFSPPAVKINESWNALKSLVPGLILPCGLSLSESPCAPGNLKGEVHTYIYIHKHTCTFVCVCAYTHTQILAMCTHFGEPSHSTLSQGAKVSKQDPAVTCTKNVSPKQSGQLWNWRPLVLRGWKAESGPISGIAEKHKKCCFGCSPESGTLAQGLPHHCHAHSLYTVFPNILVNKDVLTKRKWSSFFFSSFLLCNHASVSLILSPQRRCGCWILQSPPTTLWSSHRGQCLDSAEEQQEFQSSHSVVSAFRCRFLSGP